MTRAKVKVDPALRVVEIASGNPEEMMVSQPRLESGWCGAGIRG